MLSDLELPPAIVIDGGSGISKAGIAEEDAPRVVFPSILGALKEFNTQRTENPEAKVFVGSKISDFKQDLLTLRHPIEHGIVTNWDDLEKLWAYCFQELRTDPEERSVVLSVPPLNPRANKERTLEVMFETFNTPAFYPANSGELTLYAAGRHSGIVADIGDGVMSAVPFYESFSFSNAIQRQDFGGRDLMFYLQRLLHEKGHSFITTSELQLISEMKERLGFVSSDGATATSESSLRRSFTLPDGNAITIDKERYLCPEALFDPSLAGFSFLKGLPDLINDCLLMCDFDARANICANILVAGGCSLFPGFRDRLKFELKKLLPPTIKLQVVPVVPELYATWIGGSIFASLSGFHACCISKQDYHEYGPSITSRRKH